MLLNNNKNNNNNNNKNNDNNVCFSHLYIAQHKIYTFERHLVNGFKTKTCNAATYRVNARNRQSRVAYAKVLLDMSWKLNGVLQV